MRFAEGAFQAGDAYSDQPVVIAFALAFALEQRTAPCQALFRVAIFDSLKFCHSYLEQGIMPKVGMMSTALFHYLGYDFRGKVGYRLNGLGGIDDGDAI